MTPGLFDQTATQNTGQGLLTPQQPQAPVQPQSPSNVGGALYRNTAPEETVESRLTNLLKKDNPYLMGARASAERKAASRGLQNTSIAAESGESAAIQSALPIAQQDAQFYQQKNQAAQQAELESFLSNQQGRQQAYLYNVQGNISTRLAAQQHQYEKSLKEMGFEQEQFMQKMKTDWDKIDLDARMHVEHERLTAENKSRFDDTSNKISSDYQRDMLEVMMNPALKTTADRQAAINQLNYLTQQRMKIAAKVAEVELTWDVPKSPYAKAPAKAPETPAKTTPSTTKNKTTNQETTKTIFGKTVTIPEISV